MKTRRLFSLAIAVVMAGITLPVWPVAAAPVALAAEVVSVTPAPTVKSGSAVNLMVSLKNIGTEIWVNSGDNPVRLGTVGPRDRVGRLYHSSWVTPNRPATMKEAAVASGEVANFEFTATAAGNGGEIIETLGLVKEGLAWFDKFAVSVKLNVQPAIYKAQLTQVSPIALTLKARETATITATVKNLGDVEWSNQSAAAVKIGTAGPRDRASKFYHSSWLSANRVSAATGPVAPNTDGAFTFAIQAPTTTGHYRETFDVVAESIAWLGIPFILEVDVVPAVWSASLVGRSEVNVALAPDDTVTVWVDYKNTGNMDWNATGDNPLRLGTAGPLDRQSQFADPTWVQSNRAATVTPPVVKSGEVGRFSFTLKAPDEIGDFTEKFRLVAERITWLTDDKLSWNIAVEEELVLASPIRVGITSTTDMINVQGAGFVVRRGSDKGLVQRFKGEGVGITAISGGYQLSTGQAVQDYLRIVPLNNSVITVQTGGIGGYNTFRGIVEIRRSNLSGNVWVVNILELEDYMKGVAEVPDGWPAEAQKAQMVAARTFAVNRRNAPQADIFDLYDDTRDQVYYGYNYEIQKPALTTAAVATRGTIITYGGQPIKAYFFSDSGGATENVENVWGKGNPAQAIPYLKGVPDPYAKPIDWSATLTQDYLQNRFDETLGIAANSGEIIDRIDVAERFSSGRAKTVVFTLRSGRTVSVPFYTFDYLTNNAEVKSMNFTVQTVGYADKPDFQFVGKGWGHGVGLAQWGARNMADQGKSFSDILRYYYTGVQIANI
ncbi:MAG: SpoIID/LytB domain-containing protein [bacterium]